MEIAIFGWYGHDNAGDERIKYCLNNFLSNITGVDKIDFYDLHDNAIKGSTSQFNHYDLVIIGGGGLILSQCNYHDFIYSIKTRIITIGISIERIVLRGNAKRFALALLEKSAAFHVRDRDSLNKLAPYDLKHKVKLSADLTFLAPYAPVETLNLHNIGINLLPKLVHFSNSTLAIPFVTFILKRLQRIGFNSIVQTMDFHELIEQLSKKYKLAPFPLYCAAVKPNTPLFAMNDIGFLNHYFEKVPQFFSDQEMDACGIFISMRLHGAVFAVQKSIPVISLSYLPKNRNFMREVGLEEFVIDTFEPKNVMAKLDSILKNHQHIRSTMQAYTMQAKMNLQQELLAILEP